MRLLLLYNIKLGLNYYFMLVQEKVKYCNKYYQVLCLLLATV